MPNYKRYYLQNHYVFITVVTYNRKPILIENIDLLRESFKNTRKIFNFEIFGSVILPNHFHIMIKPENINEFSKIIGSVKKRFSFAINEEFVNKNISESRKKRSEKGVWQRRFYEHIIRDEEDLHKHLDYIHYNPVKHGYVSGVIDWKYSSFHKFVKLENYEVNWGSPNDIEHIQDLNYD
jgi:putative transposase